MMPTESFPEFNCPYCGGQELIVSNRMFSVRDIEPAWAVLYAPLTGPLNKPVQFVEWSDEANDFVPIVRELPRLPVHLSNAQCCSCEAQLDVTPDDPIGQSIARVWSTLGGQAE